MQRSLNEFDPDVAPPKYRVDHFFRAIISARVVSNIGYRAIANIPDSLPENIRSIFQESLKASIERGLEWQENDDGSWVADANIVEVEENGISNDLFYLLNLEQKEIIPGLPISHIALEQLVVTSFARLDSLIVDIYGDVCRVRPEILKRDKKISWNKVIEASSYEELVDQMIDSAKYELGMSSFEKKLEFISRKLGISFPFNEDLIANLKRAEQARHAFVHTGGAVSQNVATKFDDTQFGLGHHISVDLNYCYRLTDAIIYVGKTYAHKVLLKFYDEKCEKITEDSGD